MRSGTRWLLALAAALLVSLGVAQAPASATASAASTVEPQHVIYCSIWVGDPWRSGTVEVTGTGGWDCKPDLPDYLWFCTQLEVYVLNEWQAAGTETCKLADYKVGRVTDTASCRAGSNYKWRIHSRMWGYHHHNDSTELYSPSRRIQC